MGKEYCFDIEYKNVCPKCQSNNIGRRFGNVEDTEDYQMHYDTLKCGDCGYWDFSDAFSSMSMESDKSEVCPKCGTVGKVSLYCLDQFSGTVELKCECGHTDYIENFIGKDRWNEFQEAESKRRDAEIEREVDLLMKYGDW